MEKENESKIKELEKCIKNQSKDIKRLKKKQGRKMIRIKFVGVIFDPETSSKTARQKLTTHYLMDLKSYVTLRQQVEL